VKNLIVVIVLALLCMSASAAMASWTDSFSGYTAGLDLTAPWFAYGHMYVVSNGYLGNGLCVTTGAEDWSNLGRAWRTTGSVDTNLLTCRIKQPVNPGGVMNDGGMLIALTTGTNHTLYTPTDEYIQIQAYNNALYYYSNPGGTVVLNGSPLSITADEWWDLKLEKVGADWVGSAKKTADSTWTTIGTASGTNIPSGFVPNYLTVYGFRNKTITDDISVSDPFGTPPPSGVVKWTDDFSVYTEGVLTAPWVDINDDIVVANNGFTSNGLSSPGNGRCFRATGDVNTQALTCKFMIPIGSPDGGINFGLQSDTTSAWYGLTGDYIQLQTYRSATSSKVYFYTNPAGGTALNGSLDIVAGEWYDMKLEKVGADWVGSAKFATDSDWMVIGAATGTAIPSTFVPNYVGISYYQNNIVIDDVSVYVPAPILATLTGTVNLLDFSGDKTAIPVTVELGNGIDPITLNLDVDGKFTIADVAAGTYDVRIKASHWLAKMTAGVEVTTGIKVMDPVDLTNGDVVDNNEVDFSDINAVRAAYGSFPGDETWNELADVDGSGEVDFTDINIVRSKYGEIGD
jgi:hypothetical protein